MTWVRLFPAHRSRMSQGFAKYLFGFTRPYTNSLYASIMLTIVFLEIRIQFSTLPGNIIGYLTELIHSNDTLMSKSTQTLEERILLAVRGTLVDVIRDTTTKPGFVHPLSERTREEIRHCLDLITARQKDMAEVAGKTLDERPTFADQTSCKKSHDHE